MPSTYLKLRTNVPLTGFVRYANYWKGKPWEDPETHQTKMLPAQIQLKGSWDGSTDESLMVPVSLVGAMLEMGLLRQEAAANERGDPQYTVVNGTRKVRVLKSEEGKRKPITISWADGTTEAHPTTAITPPTKPIPQDVRDKVKAVTEPDAAKLAKVRKAHRRRLGAIAETYGCAWRAAWATIDELLAEKAIEKTKLPSHVYFDLIARLAASIGIEAHRENLVVAHKEPKTPAPAPGVPAQAGALSGAGALQPIQGDMYEPPPPVEAPDPYPEATAALNEGDDLPF